MNSKILLLVAFNILVTLFCVLGTMYLNNVINVKISIYNRYNRYMDSSRNNTGLGDVGSSALSKPSVVFRAMYNSNASSNRHGNHSSPFFDVLDSPFHRYYQVNCSGLFAGDEQAISSAQSLLDKYRDAGGSLPVPADSKVKDWFANCSHYKNVRHYPDEPMSKEEQEFPIAYVIVTHSEAAQVERLLRAIYQPQNVYCIHPDQHSDPEFHKAVAGLAKCFPNVIIASRKVRVLRGNITLVLANLNCMKDLLQHGTKWKYMINLCAKDFPLKTNFEIVEQMKAYNGHNAVNGRVYERTSEHLNKLIDRWTYHHYFLNVYKYPVQSTKLKSPPPHNITVYKGNTYIAATRNFIDFVVNDKEAQDFLYWLYDTKTPDESFTPSLQRHPRAPGGHPFGTSSTNLRYIKWTKPGSEDSCPGKRVHSVCVLGSAFLKELYELPQLFVNKFHYDFDPIMMQCTEELLEYRKHNELLFHREYPDFPARYTWSEYTSLNYVPGL